MRLIIVSINGDDLKLEFKNFTIKIEYGIFIIVSVCFLIGRIDVLYVLLFSALHELGHIITLYIFGGRVDVITISYYGIGLKHSSRLVWYKELIFLMSGIMVNIALYLFNIMPSINLSLAIINAMPIIPLDGGRAVRLVFDKLFSVTISDKIYYCISALMLVLIILFAMFQRNVSLIVISIYSVIYAINNSFD